MCRILMPAVRSGRRSECRERMRRTARRSWVRPGERAVCEGGTSLDGGRCASCGEIFRRRLAHGYGGDLQRRNHGRLCRRKWHRSESCSTVQARCSVFIVCAEQMHSTPECRYGCRGIVELKGADIEQIGKSLSLRKSRGRDMAGRRWSRLLS